MLGKGVENPGSQMDSDMSSNIDESAPESGSESSDSVNLSLQKRLSDVPVYLKILESFYRQLKE